MYILRGKGKIYDINNKYIDDVTYDICYNSVNSVDMPEWQGEITPANGTMPLGSYIIELDDGRRGPCTTGIVTYSSFGLVVDTFSVEGTGPLE